MNSSDDATCPTCGDEFANQHGMNIHHATAHDESLVQKTATCNYCGQEFDVPAGSTGQYCTTDCRDAAMRDGERVECDHCGDAFHAANWELEEGRQFCSHQCYGASLEDRDKYECAGCGRDFSVYTTANIRYCSRACMAEDRAAKPRPDDLDGLLWLLYVYEDQTARQTWLRANRHTDDWLTQDAVTDRLKENGWLADGGPQSTLVTTLEELDPDDVGLSGEPDSPDETWHKYYQEGENAE